MTFTLWDVKCPKCGSLMKFDIKYKPDLMGVGIGEMMELVCVCRYSWEILPLDSIEDNTEKPKI